MTAPTYVSVIIPCRNEERFISRCLDSVILNDYDKGCMEVLVVDGMSGDGTREIIKRYARKHPLIKLLDNRKKITPAALNTGIESARGQIIIRMDAHATYEKDYVSKCVQCLLESGADNVGGIRMTVPGDEGLMPRSIAIALSHPFGAGDAYFRIGSDNPRWVDTVFGGCYRKEVFEKIGFFDERLKRSQDMDFNIRLKKAGMRILLVPQIICRYHSKPTLVSFLRHEFVDGIWAIRPLKFGCGLFRVRHLVPFAFASSFICSAGLALFSRYFLWLFLIISGTYLCATLYFSARIAASQRDIRYLFSMPIVFAVRHLGYGLGSIWGSVTGGIEPIVRRSFDAAVSLWGLVALLPLFVVIGLSIRFDSKGAIFYRGARVGRYGKLFGIYKFRTMVPGAEMIGGSSTADDDLRITRIGKALRKHKLDELPQLINVLRGEMSLVGPRPEMREYVDMYNQEEKAILKLRPGITDWASLWNADEGAVLAGHADPDKAYLELIRPRKLELQLQYARCRSLWVDIKILLLTVLRVFRGRGGPEVVAACFPPRKGGF